MDLIKDLDVSQMELLLLRPCTGFQKIVYLLKTCRPDFDFDLVINSSIFNLQGEPINGYLRKFWALPLGGFGITISADQSEAAFATSAFGS